MNIDILDRVPQFPGGPWANHAIYGALLGAVTAGLLIMLGAAPRAAWWWAAAFATGLCAVKKAYDYRTRGPAQGETIAVCVGRTIATGAVTLVIAMSMG